MDCKSGLETLWNFIVFLATVQEQFEAKKAKKVGMGGDG